LIAAMDRELEKIPGAIWNFSQPISDNLEEAVSGVKGRSGGQDLRRRPEDARSEGRSRSSRSARFGASRTWGCFRVLGQPNLDFAVDRDQAARYGLNVSDVQDAIQTAVGGNALTQVLVGEQRYDLVLRYLPQYRDTKEAIEKIRLLAPSGERVSLAQLTNVKSIDGGSEIYREANSRYIAVKYSVRGRDLGSTVEEAIKRSAPPSNCRPATPSTGPANMRARSARSGGC
jgi:heavy metal efflux system protein